MVVGPPGSRKTTLAALLATELGLPLLAKDSIVVGRSSHNANRRIAVAGQPIEI
jgi:adenylate kinase family enzyme